MCIVHMIVKFADIEIKDWGNPRKHTALFALHPQAKVGVDLQRSFNGNGERIFVKNSLP